MSNLPNKQDNSDSVIAQLLGFKTQDPDEQNEVDKMFMRLVEYPAVLNSIKTVGSNNGKTEVLFRPMPDNVVDQVKSLIGASDISVFSVNDAAAGKLIGFRFSYAPQIGKTT